MIAVAEWVRRYRGRASGRLHSLPILALMVHSSCNCRCVMCDIWKANADRRELSAEALDSHVAALRRLRVQRVMLTGGEPLLHSNLWALCDRLREAGVGVTLVTTGLLAERRAGEIAAAIDTVVISVDGPPAVHDAVRRVRGGFAAVARGVAALRGTARPPRLIARSVVQRANYAALPDTIAAARRAGFDEISFLPADVSSLAFNRATPWSTERVAEVAVAPAELPELAAAIAAATADTEGITWFVAGGSASLWRIHHYYAALAGLRAFPEVRCNAPWVSAVLESDGTLRPCFFHAPYPRSENGGLESTLNSTAAVTFRTALDVRQDHTCRRCVCSLHLPLGADVSRPAGRSGRAPGDLAVEALQRPG